MSGGWGCGGAGWGRERQNSPSFSLSESLVVSLWYPWLNELNPRDCLPTRTARMFWKVRSWKLEPSCSSSLLSLLSMRAGMVAAPSLSSSPSCTMLSTAWLIFCLWPDMFNPIQLYTLQPVLAVLAHNWLGLSDQLSVLSCLAAS